MYLKGLKTSTFKYDEYKYLFHFDSAKFSITDLTILVTIPPMQNQIDLLLKSAQKSIDTANNLQELEHIRTQLLGKKGQLTDLLKQLGSLLPTERAQMGQVVNLAKNNLLEYFKERTAILNQQLLTAQLTNEIIDITLPGREPFGPGSIHPVNQICEKINQLFHSIGFSIIEGPEIDDDYNNFAALNLPDDHPARSMHDTFYLENGLLLRTHTSNLQNRVLKKAPLPLRVIIPGRVYRCDSDHTHTPMFHQLEGLVVDEQCTFSQLKGLLEDFLSSLFERKLTTRFRPSYFPFTEPSAEMDIHCVKCNGVGCRVCSHTGWLEVLGCGMVHPNVLSMAGIDSERYTGFAFGAGIDRLAMLRYGIDDLRKFFENDVRFLRQF